MAKLKYINKPNKSFRHKMCKNRLKVSHTITFYNKVGKKREKLAKLHVSDKEYG